MRPALVIFSVMAGVLLLAAALAPPIYWCAQSLAAHSHSSVLQSVAANPIGRFVSRIAMILGVIAVLLLLRRPLFREVLPRSSWWPMRRWQFGAGLLVGLAGIGVLIGAMLLCDARSLRPLNARALGQALLLAASGALLVGVIEEFVFRGVLLGALLPRSPVFEPRRGTSLAGPILLASLLFASVHLLHSAPEPPGGVTASSGFAALAAMIAPAAGTHANLLPWVVNLTLCGAILSVVYWRTGSLWAGIGLHAGWIFWLKFANALTRVAAVSSVWWGTRKVVDGWAATLCLAATAVLVIAATPKLQPSRGEP